MGKKKQQKFLKRKRKTRLKKQEFKTIASNHRERMRLLGHKSFSFRLSLYSHDIWVNETSPI